MNQHTAIKSFPSPPTVSPAAMIGGHATVLRDQLQAISSGLFPPTSSKTLRRFSSTEAARIIGVTVSRLQQLATEGLGPPPEVSPNGRRSYSLADIHGLRTYLDENTRGGRRYQPHRHEGDHLQVIAVANFKGGSGKTTTAAHLAQSLVLRGYRVLAIDLDPQASLSALLGVQPELDVNTDETLYGAIRYDEARRPLSEIIRHTYFTGLDLVPANLELMEFEHETPRALNKRRAGEPLFFDRVAQAIETVEASYDVVVIDCPPQLGYLTLSALCASTSLLITVHPQMLDVASMSQFLAMTEDLLGVVSEAGGNLQYDWLRYLVTRYEQQDAPQTRIVGMLRTLFDDAVLTAPMLKSSAVSDAGLSKQTLYEIGRDGVTRSTYDRALEALESVNGEIEGLLRKAWRRA
ncbi:plasmid partitioning protein RepA [Methylobacterium brachiatum]|jgi:chromosome partitioning protein|uniref:Chromosome partitioning protein n=2 Tax=Methylobacterium TaxID=407 RepID=A0AAJ1TTB6_9HYPH|nr:plasmid partitioning protein RepA [Methylobacterium sp. GXF4]MBP32508.1 plasmid partitioning protein RepA [Methylobacterium sp.]MDQ0546802.1 chromosome partitioning protein [Methylobacterium brachiatum]